MSRNKLEENPIIHNDVHGPLRAGPDTRAGQASFYPTLYDLQGRKVGTHSRKGLYIKDGRKVVK